MSLSPLTSHEPDGLLIWPVDPDGNIAMSRNGLALLAAIRRLAVPQFASTEHATSWGSQLSTEEHATLLHIQRRASSAACEEADLQRMVDRATKSQLLREAAEASVPGSAGGKSLPFHLGGPAQGKD